MTDIIERLQREDRMQRDGAMIFDEHRWPLPVLHVKTQPWWPGEQEFGIIQREHKTLVINKDKNGMNEGFSSIAALVEKWSVD